MNRYTKIRDFHASRLTGVGSSDIPTLALYNKRWGDTPLTLYREKVGITPPKETGERAEWGHRLEGIVLAKFIEKRYGEETAAEYLRYKARKMSVGAFKTETECRHPERPYVLAHADLVVDDMRLADDGKTPLSPDEGVPIEPYIVEAKTTGLMSAKRDEDEPDEGYSKTDFSQNGIPAKVFLQVQWQMLAYDVPTAYVAVLVDGGEYREYGPIKADPRTQEKCLKLAEVFWRDCVVPQCEPKPETWDDVQLMWPETKDFTARIGGEDELKVRAMSSEYFAAKKRIKELTERTDEIVDAFGILMGENSVLTSGEGVQFASSWNVGSLSIKKFSELTDAQRAEVPEDLAEKWKTRDEIIERLAEAEKLVAEDAAKIETLTKAGVVKTGYRVLRPTKIKGAA
jgi:predicted phage-related endonuclease